MSLDSGRDRAERRRQAFREQTIRRLLRRWETGREGQPGVFGGVVCQVCGKFGTFMGVNAVIGLHRSGQFTHPWCSQAVNELRSRPTLFCEICRVEVPREEPGRRVARWTLCAACRDSLRVEAPSGRPEEVLWRLTRWRYWRMYGRPTPKW